VKITLILIKGQKWIIQSHVQNVSK